MIGLEGTGIWKKCRIITSLEIKQMTYDRRKRVSGADRRQWPRIKPVDLPFLKKVEVSKGAKIEIVNISRGGLLLETETRLGPDLKIEIKLVTTKGVFEMEGVTLRSSVFSLKGAPRYRTAIIFKDPFDLMDAVYTAHPDQAQEGVAEDMVPGVSGEMDGQQPQQDKPGKENTPPVLTVVASDTNGICLNESFELNDW